jgi:hypothetical protein
MMNPQSEYSTDRVSQGFGSNVWIFEVENGEYGRPDEPQKPQNFVRLSK